MNIWTVTYNRKTKTWQLLGDIGEVIASFPPGAEGQTAARMARIEHYSPYLTYLVTSAETHWPTLNGRALRGAELVITNAIKPHASLPNRWTVNSQTWQDRAYTVRPGKTTLMCSCKDWANGQSKVAGHNYREPTAPAILIKDRNHIICKHIAAHMLQECAAAHAEYTKTLDFSPPRTTPSCGSSVHWLWAAVAERDYQDIEKDTIGAAAHASREQEKRAYRAQYWRQEQAEMDKEPHYVRLR